MALDVHDRIVTIIAEQAMLEPGQIHADMSPTDLGIDSLGMVEALFAIEEAFDISIPYNVNEPDQSDFDVSSLGSIIAAVERLVAEKE